MTTVNEAPSTNTAGDWVAMIPVRLSGDEKRLLEAISVLGSHAVTDGEAIPVALYRLGAKGLVENTSERTRTGRRRSAGFDVYRLTELGEQWLEDCRPACSEEASQ